jgi:hypothetical protein
MRYDRVVLTTVPILGCVAAFLLGTVGTSSPADAVESRSRVRVDHRPQRDITARTAAPVDPISPPGWTTPVELDHSVRLVADLRDVLPSSGALVPTWDAERVWPLPQDLPEDDVVLALQDVLASTGSARLGALDALDAAIAEAEEPSNPWTLLAHIEAERTLGRLAYEEELAHHEAALVAWADAGGQGPLPDAPQPWSGWALGDDALQLAKMAEALDEDPLVADLASLTAAATWLDWNSDELDEDGAVETLLEVIDRSDDPAVLAGAVDLLVGTRPELPAETLEDLQALTSTLPDDVAVRLSWFVSDRWLEQGEAGPALTSLDRGIAVGAELEDLDAIEQVEAMQRARGAVVGSTLGKGGATTAEQLDALAWRCWTALQDEQDPWVQNGTDYSGTVVMLPGGLSEWTEWTDDNAHRHCMVDGIADLGEVEVPTRARVWIRVEG